MSAPPKPEPPVIGKVTHHSIELYWDKAGTTDNVPKGDGRLRFTIQEEDRTGGWGNVYTGYAKRTVISSLEATSLYRYRLRVTNDHGSSEFSPVVTVSTTKEPLTADHLHRAILLTVDIDKVIAVLETGEVWVDTPDKFGFTPLMNAAQKGHKDIVKVLIEYGADVNAQTSSGKDALMLTCFVGHLDVVKILRQHGAKWTVADKGGSTAIHWAVDGGNTELLRWMIRDGADVSARESVSGWTPLIRCATMGGNVDIGRVLINADADVNARDSDGKTALMNATLNGHQALIELLVSRGADLYIQNDQGKTAIHMAHSFDRKRVIKFFEEIEAKTGQGDAR
ncbi:uncharacterized protein [Antedon mediterranea]|uniref:uncharacterized protein n=1 Tax=Antedon mediterranea TaxID=105859 RepID=UPI003AF5341E